MQVTRLHSRPHYQPPARPSASQGTLIFPFFLFKSCVYFEISFLKERIWLPVLGYNSWAAGPRLGLGSPGINLTFTWNNTRSLGTRKKSCSFFWANSCASKVLISPNAAKHLYKLVQTSEIHQIWQAWGKFKLLITTSITSTELFINNWSKQRGRTKPFTSVIDT